jgi:putative transposase
MEQRNGYETDVSDEEWKCLKPLVPTCQPGGRPPKYSRREILNGIFLFSKAVVDLLPSPSAGRTSRVRPSLDSQSIRTSELGGIRGYDAGKKICGRKRHLLVDTLGLLLLVAVTAANVQDRQGARTLLSPLADQFRCLRLIWADGAYAGKLESWIRGLRKWGKLRLDIVRSQRTERFLRSSLALDGGANLCLARLLSTTEV